MPIFDAKTVSRNVNTAGEPAGGEFVRILLQYLSEEMLTLLNGVEEIHFNHIGLCRLRPYWSDSLFRRHATIQRSTLSR